MGTGGAGHTGTGGAGATPGRPCEFELWQSPDAGRHSYHCHPTGARTIECDCDGRLASEPSPLADDERLEGQACADALEHLCGVDNSERTGCDRLDGADCWPSDAAANAWLCKCEDGGTLTEVRSISCSSAAFTRVCRHGPGTCADSTGHCKRHSDTSFDCACVESAPEVRTLDTADCRLALAACPPSPTNPPSDLGPCSNGAFDTGDGPNGHCEYNTSSSKTFGDGFDCQCLPGPDHKFDARFDKIPASSCEQALAYFCPEAAP
jgi:hypothetical protein